MLLLVFVLRVMLLVAERIVVLEMGRHVMAIRGHIHHGMGMYSFS